MAEYKTNAQEIILALLGDPEKAADLILDVGDELIDAGKMEALSDGVKVLLQPYLVTVLASLQAKLAAVEITAED